MLEEAIGIEEIYSLSMKTRGRQCLLLWSTRCHLDPILEIMVSIVPCRQVVLQHIQDILAAENG